MIEAEIEHVNKRLCLSNEIVVGRYEEDGFYFKDRSELSWNWDIVKWRYLNE